VYRPQTPAKFTKFLPVYRRVILQFVVILVVVCVPALLPPPVNPPNTLTPIAVLKGVWVLLSRRY